MNASQDWRDRHVVAGIKRPNVWGDEGWQVLGWNHMDDVRNALRRYARLGLHPIVLHGLNEDNSCTCGKADCGRSRGKHPVEGRWQKAAFDLDAADRLFLKNWRYNIGLRMGHQPNGSVLVCIDVDGPMSLLDPLIAKDGPLPPTLTASSGKGTHLIFRLRSGVEPPSNRVRLADGVDVRSEGGQIVAAPSRHYSGRTYRWTNVQEPAVLP